MRCLRELHAHSVRGVSVWAYLPTCDKQCAQALCMWVSRGVGTGALHYKCNVITANIWVGGTLTLRTEPCAAPSDSWHAGWRLLGPSLPCATFPLPPLPYPACTHLPKRICATPWQGPAASDAAAAFRRRHRRWRLRSPVCARRQPPRCAPD